MPVPETAVDEDGDPPTRKNDIRCAWQITAVQTETQSLGE